MAFLHRVAFLATWCVLWLNPQPSLALSSETVPCIEPSGCVDELHQGMRHHHARSSNPEVLLGLAQAANRSNTDNAGSGGAIPHCALLRNINNVVYTIDVRVGSEREVIRCVGDTGSDAIVVPGAACKSCADKSKRAYDPARSVTARPSSTSVEIEYGSGTVTGRMVRDTVSAAGITVDGQSVVVMRHESLGSYRSVDFDGIFGFGAPHAPHAGEGFLARASVDEFSVCLSRNGGGDLVLGHDPRQDFQRVPVVGRAHWAVHLGGISLTPRASRGGWPIVSKTVCANAPHCRALLDTGTTLIVAPHEHLTPLFSDLCNYISGCRGDNATQRSRSFVTRVLDCPPDLLGLPTIEFALGQGRTARLSPINYIMLARTRELSLARPPGMLVELSTLLTVTAREVCVPAFMEASLPSHARGGPAWIFGMPMFREYTVLFDRGGGAPSIGFGAPASCCGMCGECNPMDGDGAPPGYSDLPVVEGGINDRSDALRLWIRRLHRVSSLHFAQNNRPYVSVRAETAPL